MLEERPNPDWPTSEAAKWRPDLMMEDETGAADWNGGRFVAVSLPNQRGLSVRG